MTHQILRTLIWTLLGVAVPCLLVEHFSPMTNPTPVLIAVLVGNFIGYMEAWTNRE